MGLFKRKKEERELDIDKVSGEIIRSDGKIGTREALALPAFSAALDFVSGIAAGIEAKLYQVRDGIVHEIRDDRRIGILNDDTHDLFSGYELKRAMIRDYFLEGAAYAYIEKRGNEVTALKYIPYGHVTPYEWTDPMNKSASIAINGKNYRDFEFIRLLRNTDNGITGKSIVKENESALGAAYALMTLANTMMKTGGNKKGVITSENKLTEPVLSDLKEGFRKLYSNAQTGFMILNKGLDFKDTANTPVEMQLSENKKAMNSEITSLFLLSPEIFTGKLTAPEYLNAVKTAVQPIFTVFEAALNKNYLTEKEKEEGWYWLFDTKQLFRADIETRYRAYTEAVRAGWITKNEIRYEEDYPRIEGLDIVSMSLGDVIYDTAEKKFFTPNMNAITDTKGGTADADGDRDTGRRNDDP